MSSSRSPSAVAAYSRRAGRPRDRAMAVVPWLGAAVIVILLFAVSTLAGHADDTEHRFAWTIAPHATSYFMAAGYTGGIYFFARVLGERRWHRMAIGIAAVSVFVWAMTLATVIDWDRFHHGEPPMVAWTSIYAVAALVVPGVWLAHRGRDDGTFEVGDAAVPAAVRAGAGVVGALLLGLGLSLFIRPSLLQGSWPWTLTDLTGRVVGGFFLLPAMVLLQCARDRRWSAWRIPLETHVVAVTGLLGAALAARGDLRWSRPATVLYVAGEAALLVAIVAVLVTQQRRIRWATAAPRRVR